MGELEWYVPALIFLARICDVSIGTVRTILLLAGTRLAAALLGFVEVLIWVLAVGNVIRHGLESPVALLAYAGGYATGVYVGMLIEERLAIGFRIARIICADNELNLSARLRERGFRVTRLEGSGRSGPVEIAFTVIQRRRLAALREVVYSIDPDAFMTVERVDRPLGGNYGEPNAGLLDRMLSAKR